MHELRVFPIATAVFHSYAAGLFHNKMKDMEFFRAPRKWRWPVAHFLAWPVQLFGAITLMAQPTDSSLDLAELSLEELADMQISSVSRRQQSLSGAAASIYVITQEDIRRSGATNLPEVLRLAPNLQVARVDSMQYALTARGSRFDLGEELELDLHLRGVDELTVQPVPAYVELDARLAWYPLENFEISLAGRNLLHERHPEFGDAARRSGNSRSILMGFRLQL